MAHASSEVQLQSDAKARPGDASLIDVTDWLRADDEAEAQAQAEAAAAAAAATATAATAAGARQDQEPARKRVKGASGGWVTQATTRVHNRPSSKSSFSLLDDPAHDLLLPLVPPAAPLAPMDVYLDNKNWVGQLVEFGQAHPADPAPSYSESSPGLNLFSCEVSVTIAQRAHAFPDSTAVFARKKDAKQYAAKLAIEWLIANRHMPADGSVSFPKARPAPMPSSKAAAPAADPLVSSGGGGGGGGSGPSYGQRVAELCTRLGMSPPAYIITPHAEFQAMYSGYAVFENSPVVAGRVGEFDNVYGKKKAREACAEKVLTFLEGVAADRAARAGLTGGGAKLADVESGSSLVDL